MAKKWSKAKREAMSRRMKATWAARKRAATVDRPRDVKQILADRAEPAPLPTKPEPAPLIPTKLAVSVDIYGVITLHLPGDAWPYDKETTGVRVGDVEVLVRVYDK